MKRLQIFRTGKHTSAAGMTLNFSESDLRASVDAYDPKLHQAPMVIGHPDDTAPAYGWIDRLHLQDDGTLAGDPSKVEPAFAEAVKAGRYRKRSASFYHPDSPRNPAPGVYYLRHVGFLGAAPPAVKGLADPEFHDTADDYIEFADAFVMSSIATMFKRLRDGWIERFGVDEADKTFPEFLIDDIAEAGKQPEPEPEPAPSFSDPKPGAPTMTLTPEQITELQAQAQKAKELEQENERLKGQTQDFAERAARLARQENEQAIDALVAEGRLVPGSKAALLDFVCDLDAAETVEFGEGESKQKGTRRDVLLAILKAQPKAVDFGEHSGETGAHGPPEGGDPNDVRQVAERARRYREQIRTDGRTISFTEAVGAVHAGLDLQ